MMVNDGDSMMLGGCGDDDDDNEMGHQKEKGGLKVEHEHDDSYDVIGDRLYDVINDEASIRR